MKRQVGDVLSKSVAFWSREVEMGGEPGLCLLQSSEGISWGTFKLTFAESLENRRTRTTRDVERVRGVPRCILVRQGGPLKL